MTSPVETPLPCESAVDHVHTAAPEFEPDRPSRELTLSSFDPASRIPHRASRGTVDYDTVMAEIDRLSRRVQELKMVAARLV